MTQHLLIKFQRNWADEFDVYGLKVCTAEEWAQELAYWDTDPEGGPTEWPVESSFGTNEWHTFIDREDLLSAFEIIAISYSEYLTLKRLVATQVCGEYGRFPWAPGA